MKRVIFSMLFGIALIASLLTPDSASAGFGRRYYGGYGRGAVYYNTYRPYYGYGNGYYRSYYPNYGYRNYYGYPGYYGGGYGYGGVGIGGPRGGFYYRW